MNKHRHTRPGMPLRTALANGAFLAHKSLDGKKKLYVVIDKNGHTVASYSRQALLATEPRLVELYAHYEALRRRHGGKDPTLFVSEFIAYALDYWSGHYPLLPAACFPDGIDAESREYNAITSASRSPDGKGVDILCTKPDVQFLPSGVAYAFYSREAAYTLSDSWLDANHPGWKQRLTSAESIGVPDTELPDAIFAEVPQAEGPVIIPTAALLFNNP